MAATLIDLDALLAAVGACQVAARPIASDKGDIIKRQAGKPSSRQEESDQEDSHEDWVEAVSGSKDSGDKKSDSRLSDIVQDTEQRLQDIKQTLQKLAEQVSELQQAQKANEDIQKQALIKMMPAMPSCPDHSIISYGNQFGHGVKCTLCQTNVFRRSRAIDGSVNDVTIQLQRWVALVR